MWPFRKKEERDLSIEELIASAKLSATDVNKDKALQIPEVAACTNLISNVIAGLPIKLYKEQDGNAIEVNNDKRVKLLNDDTGDIMDGFQFKKALIEDYLLDGKGYAYINKYRNDVKSLHYVDSKHISVIKGTDPIKKDVKLLVNGKEYENYQFISLTRKTKDGVTGKGIVEENRAILSLAYNSLLYEENNIKTGGIKKGVIKSGKKLDKDALDQLKRSWNQLYSNNTENCIILNEGLDYKELQQTSVELQLTENKLNNASSICELFNTPVAILNGTANADVMNNWLETTIVPILNSIESALNKNLLLTKEKSSFYFAFDTRGLFRGDIEKRYRAYEIGIKNGFLQSNEVRFEENLAPLAGLDFIKLGLADVLYNPKTKEIYTPNTNESVNLDDSGSKLEAKGGEEDENRNQG